MFMKGKLCELRVLMESQMEAELFTSAVNAGLTTRHLFTGSWPMRPLDCVSSWKKEREAGSVQFGVWVDRKFIGTTGLYSHRDIYRSWEFRALIFDPDEIGKGIGTEATRMVVDYGFTRLNAHRVWLGVSSANDRAIACYRKVGFVEEGRLRDEIFAYGKYHNAVRMGILEEEWSRGLSSSAAAVSE